MSSKYTRSFVRKRMPKGFRYIIDELLHAHFEDHDKDRYYGRILTAIVDTGRADAFIEAMCTLIRRLAVFRLHIVGDLFDRGARPDVILDQLIAHHSVDVQWGNHDVQWMGAAAAARCAWPASFARRWPTTTSKRWRTAMASACGPFRCLPSRRTPTATCRAFCRARSPAVKIRRKICGAPRACTRPLPSFCSSWNAPSLPATPEFGMEGRALLQHIDFQTFTVQVEGRRWPLRDTYFPHGGKGRPRGFPARKRTCWPNCAKALPKASALRATRAFVRQGRHL